MSRKFLPGERLRLQGQMRQMAAAGRTIPEIAKAIGVAYQTVWRWAVDEGVAVSADTPGRSPSGYRSWSEPVRRRWDGHSEAAMDTLDFEHYHDDLPIERVAR